MMEYSKGTCSECTSSLNKKQMKLYIRLYINLHIEYVNISIYMLIYIVKVQLCKLYNNKYMSTQIRNTEGFAFIDILVF